MDKRLGFGANGNVYLVNNNNLISVVKVYQYDADDHMFVQDAQTSYPMEVFTLQLALDKNLQGSVHSSFYETATHPLSGKLYHLIGMKYKPGYIPLNQFVAENRHRFMAQADGDDNDERNKLAETIFGNVVANTLELHQAGIYHNDIKGKLICANSGQVIRRLTIEILY